MKATARILSPARPAAVSLSILAAVIPRAAASPPGIIDVVAGKMGVEIVAVFLIIAALCVTGLVFRAGTRLLRRLEGEDKEGGKE